MEIHGFGIPECDEREEDEEDRRRDGDAVVAPTECLAKVEGARALLKRLEDDRLAMVEVSDA